MKTNYRHIILTYLAIICIGAVPLSGQTLEKYIAYAEESYANKEYYASLHYYLKALELGEDGINAYFGAAESARRFHAYKLAASYYEKVLEEDMDGNFPLARFWLADMQMRLGDYSNAQTNLETFLDEYDGENPYYVSTSERLIESIQEYGANVDAKKSTYEISKLEQAINTPYSEVGAALIYDRLYFSSLRFPNKSDYLSPSRPLAKLLFALDDSDAEQYKDIDEEGKHIGNVAFDEEDMVIYYTKCIYSQGEETQCNLFKRAYGLELGDEIELTSVNISDFTTTQPSIGLDANGKKVLYFVSDRSGGVGGMDIWKSEINGENYSTPVNLSDINTKSDEISPFYSFDHNALFFSSQGYKGFGGFDIYKTAFSEDKSLFEPTNMGSPLNSSYNDVYFSIKDSTAYFSSNRLESNYIDTLMEACCYDIYKAKVDPTVKIIVKTFDAETKNPLNGAVVSLMEGADVTTDSKDNSHIYHFDGAIGKSYHVTGNKSGYMGDEAFFNTNNLTFGDEVVQELYLTPDMVELLICVRDKFTNEPIFGADVIVEDKETGEVIYKGVTPDDSHCVTTEVLKGRDYKVTGSKLNYEMDMKDVMVSLDAPDLINVDLYLASIDFASGLPIILYFDNDIPSGRKGKTTTNKDYSSTYDKYLSREARFKDRYSSLFEDVLKPQAEQDIDQFFAEVQRNKLKYDEFLDKLLAGLQEGKKYDLKISGYASPRAEDEYNEDLSKRRVHSILNDLRAYRGGALESYLDNGNLSYSEFGFGERQASPEAKATENEEIPSIYSIEASKERRVEIVAIVSKK